MVAVRTNPPQNVDTIAYTNILWGRITEQIQDSKQRMPELSIAAAMDCYRDANLVHY